MTTGTPTNARRRWRAPLVTGLLAALATGFATTPAHADENPTLLACTSIPSTADPNVLKIVYEVASGLRVSDKVLLAGFEAGWVESHMNNLNCGDRDSLGVFQQRPSQGWGTPAQIRDVAFASNSFFSRAIPAAANHPTWTAGQVAQEVQRSAFPSRYDQAEGTARTLIERARQLANPTPPLAGLTGDWNGDGKADVGVYRPSTSTWLVPRFLDDPWGGAGDIPVAGAWNGNGRTYMGVFRNGDWLIPGFPTHRWGGAGDVPVPADYNGDGRTDMAVWRPSTGQYLIPGLAPINFGASNAAIPAPADFNGDRRAEPAVFVNGAWKLQGRTENWGGAGDIPVPGDWNGDGNADIAVWRPSTGKWLIPGVPANTWGGPGDIPVPMNWNGGTRVYMTVFRPSSGDWLVPGRTTVRWGGRGDVPIGTTGNAAIWKALGIRL